MSREVMKHFYSKNVKISENKGYTVACIIMCHYNFITISLQKTYEQKNQVENAKTKSWWNTQIR